MKRERWLVWFRHSYDGPITERMLTIVDDEGIARDTVAFHETSTVVDGMGRELTTTDTFGYRKLADGEKPGP